ncbi:MAG TPA: MFS transporter [Firmicutes bacterium]|nr:MFS transporter [Bacillota bacterium]
MITDITGEDVYTRSSEEAASGILLAVLTIVFWASLYLYVPILPSYTQFIGGSLTIVGIVTGSYGFTQLILRIPTGIWSDRLGLRKPFVVAGFVAATGSAVGLALSRTPYLLVVFRAFSGVAATTWVAFTILFSSYFNPREATHAMSTIVFCNSLGQTLATFIGGLIAERYGWLAPFLGAAMLGGFGTLCSLALKEKRKVSGEALSIAHLMQVGKDTRLLYVSFLGALTQYVTFATVYGFTPLYASRIGASKAELGILSLVTLVPYTVASLIGGTWLARYMEEGKIAAIGSLVAGLTTIIIPVIETLPFLYISQAIGGFGRGLVYPVLMGLSIQAVEPDRRATAMGFFQSIYSLGMFLGPTISGAIGENIGLPGVFITASGICFLAAVLSNLRYTRPTVC